MSNSNSFAVATGRTVTDTKDGRHSRGLPGAFWIAWLTALVLGVSGQNWPYALASLTVLPVIVWLNWQVNSPPVLAAAIFLTWLQISIRVFHGNLLGVPFQSLHTYNEHITQAFFLGLIGTICFSVGIWLNLHKAHRVSHLDLRRVAERYDTFRAVVLYGLVLMGSSVVRKGVGMVTPGLDAPIAALLDVKWVLFYAAFVLVFLRKEYRFTLAVLFGIEFLSGFGYFSGFKFVLIFLALSVFGLTRWLRFRDYALLVALFAATAVMGIIWSAIKPTYRPFLSQGEQQQIVLVSKRDALAELVRQVGALNREDLNVGVESFVSSLSYIHFFSACLGNVPEHLAFQHGRVWLEAFFHVVEPRVLFPDKPILDQSKETNRYCGTEIPEAEQGVSAALGYYGESYVDFGKVMMFLPVFAVGWCIGRLYRSIVNFAPNSFLSCAGVLPLFLLANNFGLPAKALLANLGYYSVMALFLWRMGLPVIDRLLRGNGVQNIRQKNHEAKSRRRILNKRGHEVLQKQSHYRPRRIGGKGASNGLDEGQSRH